jgi:hypothetical protein
MKELLSVLLLASASALAQNSSAPALAAAPAAADARTQKARQLLDQMVVALGGDAWLTYRTFSQQGRSYSFFHGKPTSAGTLSWRFYEYPDKERREMSKQRDVVYIYNGDKGYEKTFKGTAAEDDKTMQEILRRRRHSLEVVVRQWLKDPNTVLFYDGQSVAAQQMVDVVTLLNKDNDQLSIGIDINTRLPVNKRYTWRDADKYKVTDETVYGNYRKVQGIETAYTITSLRDGEIIGQNFLTNAEYNTTFAPGFFDAAVTYDPQTYNPRTTQK